MGPPRLDISIFGTPCKDTNQDKLPRPANDIYFNPQVTWKQRPIKDNKIAHLNYMWGNHFFHCSQSSHTAMGVLKVHE